jgi:hypothetical protein
MQSILTPLNVAESNLALLRAAEFSNALGKKAEARQSLAAFESAWPNATQMSWLSTRLKKLGSEL